MVKGSEGSLERLWRAEQLMGEGKVDEARPLIENLERETNLPPDARLTYQLLKSQLLAILGDFEASQQLADHVWTESRDREKPLQRVDAAIVRAESLLFLGRYEESLEVIIQGEKLLTTLTEERAEAFTKRQAALMHFRGRGNLFQGEIDQAMEYSQQSLALRQELGNKHDIAVSLQNIGVMHDYKGNKDKAIEHHERALKLFQEIGNKHRLAWCLTNTGGLYANEGNFKQGLAYSQQGLILNQEIGSQRMIGYSHYGLALIYLQKGDLDQALEHCQQGLSIAEAVGWKWLNGQIIGQIAGICQDKGELDRALEYSGRFLALAQKDANELLIAGALSLMGIIHWQKGDLEQGKGQLEEALSYYEQLDNKLFIAGTLYWLVPMALDQGAHSQAQEYLHRLQDIKEQEENKIVSQQSRLAEGLVLKTSSRIRDKVRAQEIFQQVADEELIEYSLTERAMINLCELLLDELKAYGEAAVLQEARTLVNKLYGLAQDQNSFSLVVNALILQAKLALVDGEPVTAEQFLEQAKFTAEEKGLGLLVMRVSRELKHLQAQSEVWQQLIRRNAPFHERLERVQIAAYLKDVEKLVNVQKLELSS
ncbi:MAG: tetratricopeptide repeat protein [Candidatus Hodarchaeales archaeon]|jgi:tetratricopeptide (TPR) repeat protein